MSRVLNTINKYLYLNIPVKKTMNKEKKAEKTKGKLTFITEEYRNNSTKYNCYAKEIFKSYPSRLLLIE